MEQQLNGKYNPDDSPIHFECQNHELAFCDYFWHETSYKTTKVEEVPVKEGNWVNPQLKVTNQTDMSKIRIYSIDDTSNKIGPIKVKSDNKSAKCEKIEVEYIDKNNTKQTSVCSAINFDWEKEFYIKVPVGAIKILKININFTVKDKSSRSVTKKYWDIYTVYKGNKTTYRNDWPYIFDSKRCTTCDHKKCTSKAECDKNGCKCYKDKCDTIRTTIKDGETSFTNIPMQNMGHPYTKIVTETQDVTVNANITINGPWELQGDLEIDKKDVDSKSSLNGAEFVLQKNASTYLQLKNSKGNIVNNIEIVQDIVFSSSTKLKVNGEDYTANYIKVKSNATKLIMKKDGKIVIKNIRYGKYRFYEVDNRNYGYTKMVNSNVMEIMASKKITETLTNEKQVGEVYINKKDYDNKDKKLENVEFVLKDSNKGQYLKVKATGSDVLEDENEWAKSIKGSATIKDTSNKNNDSTLSYTSSIIEATKFVTDTNGEIAIKNLLISTDGTKQTTYILEEYNNTNYAYQTKASNQTFSINRNDKKSIEITNEKQVGNLKIYKKDFDDSNKNIKNATFVLKTSSGYVKVKATGNSVTNDKTTGYATKIVGSATINDSANNTDDKVAVFNESKENATKFVTDANGIIEIKNLLMSNNGKDAITYTIEEISNTNYAYTKLADFKDVTIERTKTKEITIKNMKQTGDLEISKIDYDNQKILLKNVEFAIKSSYGKGYIKIRATGDSITKDKDGYATKVVGSAKINDTTEDDVTPSIKYVANANDATKFVTDSSGKISIKNLISTVDGTTNITYTIEELSNDNYGYTKKVNNLTTTVERLDVRKVILRNEKQVGNISIKKVDDRVENKKLGGVEFVLKSSYKKDTYIKVKGTCTNSTKDKNGYLTSATGNVVINDTAENSKTPSIEYVTKMEDATKFVTDANGQLAIQNLLMSTNGTDKITYKFIETKNPNYGYLAYENGVVEMNHGVTFIGDSKSTINKDGEFTIPRKGTMNYTIKNHQEYIRIEGYVWEEMTNSKDNSINNVYDKDLDALIEGLKVYLYKDDQVVAQTTTNSDGWYGFGTRKKDGEAYTSKDYLTVSNGDLKIDDLSKYHVEFEYDGLRFTSIKAIKDYLANNYDNTSKATEVPSGRNDRKDRASVNEDFTTVSRDTARNSSDQKTYDLSYDFADHVSTYKDKWGYSYNDNKTKLKVTPAAKSEYAVIASTSQTGFKLDEAWNARCKDKGSDTLTGINLGVHRRNQADLAVSSDLTEMNIAVNNGQNVYNNTYTYAKRTSEENTDNFGVEVKFGTGIGSYSSRGLNIYTRRIYESDLALENLKPGSMQLYVTYKMRVKNQSTVLNAKVKELANYYDARYEVADSWIADGKGNKTGSATWGDSKYGRAKVSDVYKAAYTTALANTEILPGEYVDVYIKFKLNNDAVKALIQKQTTLNNVSEINAFSSISSGKAYAAIDDDSNPGSVEIKLQNDGTTTATKLNGRNYEIENKTLDMTTFEDDTDSAPSLVLGIQEAEPTRGLSGTVFEDSSINGDKTNTGKERIGDGIFQDKENKVANAKVELLNENGEVVKLYEISIANGVETTQTKEASTTTDANGEYKFLGVLPGRYLIRYTYDSNTTINGKAIDPREYKSTIISSDVIKNALKLGQADERKGNYNWIIPYEGKRYSDAADDLNKRTQQEQNGVYNGNINTSDSMTADTAYFDVGVEYSEVKENSGFNQKVSYTDYKDEYNLDNGKIVVIKDGKIVLADTFYAVNPYQDFGIIERPRQQFETNKRISNIKVTLANGQVLINGNPYKTIPDAELYDSWNEIEKTADNALPYVKALPSSVLAEIDNELLQGATLEVEYTVSIKNDSELDYEYTTNSDYYYYGTKLPGQELKRVIKKVVDYMDDNLVYDENNNSAAGWNKVTADQLSAWQEGDITKKLVSDEVKADINKGYTISITDQFARNELKAGEATSIKIYGSKLLASNENGIGASNHVEIVETARKIYGATPGNYDPKTATPNKPYESDDDMTRVNITPPTGLTDNRTFIISLAAIVLVVVVGEIYFIKKKVLK